jgi:hypothetical protein
VKLGKAARATQLHAGLTQPRSAPMAQAMNSLSASEKRKLAVLLRIGPYLTPTRRAWVRGIWRPQVTWLSVP